MITVGAIEMGIATGGGAPFALYNLYRHNAAGGGTLVNDGYKGAIFNQADVGSSLPFNGQWENYTDTAYLGGSHVYLPPIYDSPNDFGGNLGPGPISVIIAPNTFRYSGVIETQWEMYGGGFGGFSLNTQWGSDPGYAFVTMRYRAVPSGPILKTEAYWDFDSAGLSGGDLVLLTVYPGTTAHTFTQFDGYDSLHPVAYHVNNASPNRFNEGIYPSAESKSNLWLYSSSSGVFDDTPLVRYIAWVNGVVDLADWTFLKWNAFSPTGDLYPPHLTP